MRTIIMFNKTYFRAWHHPKHRVRKKNYARAYYMLRRGNQISRKEWNKYVKGRRKYGT